MQYIIDLWNGSIISKNGALQLLLIVDYIFDWARDTYRQDILTELRTLSRGVDASTSVFPDTELMSTRELAVSVAPDPSADDQDGDVSLRSTFHSFDSKLGMVRHAAFVENRFCMIFVTRDNAQTLLQSTSPSTVQQLTRGILAQISGHVFSMTVETLDTLEEQWTGIARLSRSFGNNDTKFLTTLAFGTYMSPQWGQVRELCAIAIAEDAFESVVAGSKLRPGRGNAQKPVTDPVDKANVIRLVSQFQATTPRQTLLAAIKRIQLRCSPSLILTNEVRLFLDDGTLRSIVDYVYNYFKKGILEPSEAFLRVSGRHVQIREETTNENLRHPFHNLDPDLNEELRVSKSGAIILCGFGPNSGVRRSEQSDHCIYFVKIPVETLDQSRVAAAIKETFENNDVYHTTRNNGNSNIKSTPKYSRPPWNLKSVYGIDARPFGFVKWLAHMGSDPMVRQGAPRDPDGSGQYLLSRNFSPWHDPRLIGVRHDYEVFLLYRLMTTELLYWRGVAQERKEQGLVCCQACAIQDFWIRTSKPYTCGQCWQEIQAPTYPRWVSDTLAGDRTVQWTQIEEEGYSSPDRVSSKRQWWNDALSSYNGGDLPPQEQWYKDISEYPEADKEFVDLEELYQQALEYGEYQKKKKWEGRKRPRLSAGSDTE